MQTLKNPLVSVPLKFGAIGGGISMIMFLLAYVMGKNPLIDLKFFDFIIIPIFLFFAMKEFRDYRNGGIIHFWQGMSIGVINYVTLAVISALFIVVFLHFFDSGLVDLYVSDRLQILELKKEEMIDQMGESTYNQSEIDIRNTSAVILSLDDFLKKCLIGLTLTIPIAVILRRREI